MKNTKTQQINFLFLSFPPAFWSSNKIKHKLNIKTKAENSEFTQALHKRREGTLRVLIRLSRSSRWTGSKRLAAKELCVCSVWKNRNNRDHKVYVTENLWTVMVTHFKGKFQFPCWLFTLLVHSLRPDNWTLFDFDSYSTPKNIKIIILLCFSRFL